MTSVGSNKVYVVGNTSVYDGVPFTSVLERTNISLGDDQGIKSVISITPHVAGDGVMNLYVGTSYVQNGAVTWEGPFSYNIGSQFKVDFRLTGRYIAVKFEVASAANWAMNGYTFEVAPLGGRR